VLEISNKLNKIELERLNQHILIDKELN